MKKVLAFVLAVVMTLMMSATAFADVLVQYGDWLITKIENGSAWEVRGYEGSDTEISFPAKVGMARVISVGSMSFYQNDCIVAVSADGLLQQIQEYAFLEATALERVTLPDCVYYIGRGAFRGTSALKEINLQETYIDRVSDYAFQESGIEQIALPGTCTEIGVSAFRGCASLNRIDIPDSVTSIDPSAFIGCDDLVIYASSDSYAIEYAIANGIDYVLTDIVQYTFLLGDADGDGLVDVIDATLAQRIATEIEVDDPEMTAMRSDIDQSGAVEITDALFIQRFATEIPVAYAVGQPITIEKHI